MLENGQIALLKTKDILPNRFQPRIQFDKVKLNELAESIRKYGVIQPIVVRRVGNKYEIIVGERRFKASNLANKETIPAIILNLTDRDSEELALLENIQREDLTPIEEAVSYKRILDIGYINQEELAKKLGKTQSTIANKIRLLNLDDSVQEALLKNDISERHARSLLRLHDKQQQQELVKKIIDERLTVKMTDREIRKILDEEEKKELTKATSEKNKRAIPVASHRIIKVNPPEELKKERGNNIMPENQGVNNPYQPQMNPTQPMPQEPPVNPVPNYEEMMNGAAQNNMNMPQAPIMPGNPGVNNMNQPQMNPTQPKAQEPPVNQVPNYEEMMNGAAQNNMNMPQAPIMLGNPGVNNMNQPQMNPTVTPPVIEPTVNEEPIPNPNNIVMPSNLEVNEPQDSSALSQIVVPDSEIIEGQTEPSNPQLNTADSNTAPVTVSQNPNLLQAINMIRNCASNIEKLGFMIDVEEIDLEQKYQITINLNKE